MRNVFKIAILTLLTFSTISCTEQKQPERTLIYENENLEPQIGEKPAPKLPNELSLECTDQMQFTKNELKAPAGPIILTLKHTGKMEKTVMGHNLVILKPGTDISDFSIKAIDAKDTEYIPASEKSKVIAHTKLLGGGESDTIEFTIKEKGTYDYICSFPGHSGMMIGKLIVE